MLSHIFLNKANASSLYIVTFSNLSDGKNKALWPSYLKISHFTNCKI